MKIHLVSLFSLLSFCASRTHAQGIITTIAGDGVTQYIGDGWPATSYSLAAPMGVCSDFRGNVFSTDYASSRVRRISINDTIFTYAGSGTPGYSGDAAPATAAGIRNPVGVAADTAGNIYFVEEYNATVRKVNRATGIISTICGTGVNGFSGDDGPATLAKLNEPAGMCVDIFGNVYIADKANNRIRRIDAVTGIISTVAGSATAGYAGDGGAATAAQLSSPRAVTADSAGNIYIADRDNNAIRMVTLSTGVISTIAGGGLPGYSGDGAAAAASKLTQPMGVYFSRHHNIYIADWGNNVVRMITKAGLIYTIAGSGSFGFAGDGGPAIAASMSHPTAVCTDDSENVYITDWGNSAIRKVSPGVVGVPGLTNTNNILIYPNPSHGWVTVHTGSTQYADISVTDMAGRVVQSTYTTNGDASFNVAGITPGIYCIIVKTTTGVTVSKLLVDQ